MEGEGVASASASATATATATVVPSSPPHGPDFSPVGSPDIADSHFEVEEDVPQPSDDHQSSNTLTDDLRDKIIKQVEYYFSDENLPSDKFLLKYVNKDKKGFVPIAVIASFRKMKQLIQDRPLIVAALRESSQLVVNSNGNKVRRLHPLPLIEVKDPKLCTVLVENLPEDHSTENIQRIFGEAGNIKNISIHDPHDAHDPKKLTIAEKLLSGKLHALVEYETVEAAEKAVASLNNEQDWRYGMRVKPLRRSVGKHAEMRKGQRRESDSSKSSNVQVSDSVGDLENNYSSEHHDDTLDEEDEGHLAKEKNEHKGQNRGRARRPKYRGSNGHGHGTVSSGLGSEILKPPPGPKMPDGSRGFTMGRGRPPAPNPN